MTGILPKVLYSYTTGSMIKTAVWQSAILVSALEAFFIYS